MSDLLPILSGLVVITALAVVTANSNDKKEHKKYDKKDDKKDEKKDDKKYDKKEKNFFEKYNEKYMKRRSSSSYKRPKRHRIARDEYGRSYKNYKGQRLRLLTSASQNSRKTKKSK